MRDGTYVRPSRTDDLPWPRSAEDGTPLGVDLSEHWGDLVREVHAVSVLPPCAGTISWDDYEQEVALAVVRRNRTRSAHDPRREGLRHYLRMVARNVASHLAGRRLPEGTLEDPSCADAVPCPPDDLWRLEASLSVLGLRARGDVTETATGYCLDVLSGRDPSAHGAPWERALLRDEVRRAVDGAVGP